MRRNKQTSGERIVKDIKRKTRKQYSAEEKTRIVLHGLRGEDSVAELCRPLPGRQLHSRCREGRRHITGNLL